MSTSDTSTVGASTDQQKYYDPAEVEAYVAEVTNTIKTLQARLTDAVRRAEVAEQSTGGDRQPETASLGRALLLAGEVADKTIADADARGAEIIRAAEDRAVAIIEAANHEAQRLVEAAGGAAAEVFQKGEARLLAAVSAFMEGSEVLRGALARIEADATSWRSAVPSPSMAPTPAARSTFVPPPAAPAASPYARAAQDAAPPSRPPQPDLPGGVHNRASRNGLPSGDTPPEPPPYPQADSPWYPATAPAAPPMDSPRPDPGPPTTAPYYNYPPPPASGGTGERRPGGAG
jgi:DivIVA protein